MTLVELLVVVTIMVFLLALAVPNLKPMLESRLSKNAAQVVSLALQRAQMLALEKNEPVGVTFVPFTGGDGTNSDACMEIRFVRKRQYGTEEFKYGYVYNGTLYEAEYTTANNNNSWTFTSSSTMPDGELGFYMGGRLCYWDKNNNDVLDAFGNKVESIPAGLLQAPTTTGSEQSPYFTPPPAKMTIPQPAYRDLLMAPIILPRGTVVDLAWSGTTGDNTDINNNGWLDHFHIAGIQVERPNTFRICTKSVTLVGQQVSQFEPVTIMFSPEGHVLEIKYGEKGGLGTTNTFRPADTIHFLIGTWDNLSSHGNVREEPRFDNYQLTSNFWVSLNPRTGAVATNGVAVSNPYDPTDVDDLKYDKMLDRIRSARRFADNFTRNFGDF